MYSQKYRIGIIFFILIACVTVLVNGAEAENTRNLLIQDQSDFKMFATSAKIDRQGQTYIVLHWKKLSDVVGFNLYRKRSGEPSYPPTPLNGNKMISSVTNCDELKAIIPEETKEWKIMEAAFAAAAKKSQEPSILDKNVLLSKDTNILNPAQGIGKIKLDWRDRPDLCNIFQRGLSQAEKAIFDMLAITNLKFSLARGLCYIDDEVLALEEYEYALGAVDSHGNERILAKDIYVRAGTYTLPPSPKNFSVSAGDSMVLCMWDRMESDYAYSVSRSTNISGTYSIVTEEPIVFDIEHDLEGNEIRHPKPGYLDFQRWDDDGNPVTHTVNGIDIEGPKNYAKYFYKVACRDILGRIGTWSSPRSAIPEDTTPPSTPTDFRIDVSPGSTSLRLYWKKVIRDIKGHREQESLQEYIIYRAENLEDLENIESLSSYMVASITADPTDTTNLTISWIDSSSILIQTYGEKDFFYRIGCKDARDNLSVPSATISGRIPDSDPPGPTAVIDSEGHSDHINVFWMPNIEPDLAGYQIYRSICHQGEPYQPEVEIDRKKVKLGCDFILIGQVLLEDAKTMLEADGKIYFEDHSVPEGSPICYSYWIRAFDESRNLYEGDNNCPEEGEYICQKLREEIPPPAPVISGLKAQNNSVLLEWMSPPVQDLRCFHIYRSTSEDSVPNFVACVFLDGSPSSQTKWEGIENLSCADIPAEPDPTSSKCSFVDNNLNPNQVYWYRISALDWLGNESEKNQIRKIPAISTFTYTKDLPVTPVVHPAPQILQPGCDRIIQWSPTFSLTEHKGFLVFRSKSSHGPFRQVSPIVQGNKFTDNSAIEGKTYWYRVQAIDKRGRLSEPSKPVEY